MQPWYVATETFSPKTGEAWWKYMAFANIPQLTEVVSLDGLLCRPILGEIEHKYWPYIVNEDFMLHFFTDLDFLLGQLREAKEYNLLAVYRNPPEQPMPPERAGLPFEFLGYDLVDTQGTVSALTNCGGFPEVFANRELSSKGLLLDFERARQVQRNLRVRFARESHADCHLWAIFRAAAIPISASTEP